MTFLDLFSGIGGFRLGLERNGHVCAGHVEIDKFANTSYNAIHRPSEEEFFHDDITTLSNESIRGLRSRGIDILCGGFPCQAFSIAGKRAGFEDTRGTLFFDIARMARIIRPKYLFLENVKGLLSHDNGNTFEVILRTLDDIGYDAEWQVLNSKDFGVPQNRERVFIIGHLRGAGGGKVFPITSNDGENYRIQEQAVNTITTRTGEASTVGTYIVESEQFSQKINQIGNLIDTDSFGGNPQRGRVYGVDGISPSLNTVGGGGLEPKVAILRPKRTEYGKAIRKDYESGKVDESRHNMTKLEPVFDGVSNTITTVQKDNLLAVIEPKVIDDQGRIKDSYKQHDIVPTLRAQMHGNPPKVTVIEDFYKNREPRCYEDEVPTLRSGRQGLMVYVEDQKYIDGISDKYSFAKKKAQEMLDEKGFLPERFNPYNAQELGEVSPTVTACCDRTATSSTVLMKQPNFRIRKLTPKECWRLQGFPDWAFERAKAAGVSDSQLYKQAGNSVTVNVIEAIGRKL